MKLVKSLAASAAMTLFLGAPVFLVGCSKSIDDVCEDYGEACGQSAAQIQECKDGQAAAKTTAEAVGCGSAYESFVDCLTSNYETPSTAECSADNDASDECDADASAYFACVIAACAADPAKCPQ